jgi:hypothetical protein
MMKVNCSRHLNQLVDFDLPQDVRLFAGYVFPHSRNESPSLVYSDQAILFYFIEYGYTLKQCCGSMTMLVWIRIRIRIPDPDLAILTYKMQKKLLRNFFVCLLPVLFEGTFTSFFKDKKSKRVTKQ